MATVQPVKYDTLIGSCIFFRNGNKPWIPMVTVYSTPVLWIIKKIFSWFDVFVYLLRLYVPVNNFSVILGRLPGFNLYQAMGMKCFA